MSKIFDKPFLDYSELIELMRTRKINTNHTAFTYDVLESISYYNLVNGYKHSFLTENEDDMFKDNTSFEHLYYLHLIDLSLTNILFKYIILIEKSLKTKVAHIVAKNFGVDEHRYLDKVFYSNSTKQRNSVLKMLNNTYSDPHTESSTHHYKRNKNHIPPWVLASDIPFGLSIKWYSILREPEKTYVANRFLKCYSDSIDIKEMKELLKISLDLIKEYRNHTAHGRRTFNSHLSLELPKKPLLKILPEAVLADAEYNSNLGKNDFYSILMLIIILLNDRFAISLFLNDLELTLDIFKNLDFNGSSIESVLGLPDNYIERLKILSEDKYNRIARVSSSEFKI